MLPSLVMSGKHYQTVGPRVQHKVLSCWETAVNINKLKAPGD